MRKSENGRRAKTTLRWVGSLATLALLVYLFSRQGWGEILAAIRQIPPWNLIVAFGLILVSRLAVGGRWAALLSIPDVGAARRDVIRLTFAGLFASNFLPTTVGGDVVRLAGAIQLGLDGAVSAASLVVDRLIGLLGMVLAVPLGAAPLWGWLIARQGWRDLFGVSMVSAGGLLARGRELLRKLGDAFSLWRAHPGALLLSLGMTGVHMLCLFSAIGLLLMGMRDPMPLWLIAGLWSFVYLITLLPISINGYGVQEVAMTLIFTHVGGITLQSGLTIALLVRTLQMLASLPGAAFVPAILAGVRADEVTDVD